MRKNYLQNKNKRGFSIYETLIAIFILTYTVVGTLTIIQKSLSSSKFSRDQVIASFLAQDAVEYIRNLRDNAFVASNTTNVPGVAPDPYITIDWMSYISCGPSEICGVDTTASINPIQVCSGSSCRLFFNSSTGQYAYVTGAGWVASKFTRKFTIVDVPGSTIERELKVTVSWNAGPFNIQQYQVIEHFVDW